MDPVSIGAAVALLAGTKAVEKLGGEVGAAGWGLANRIVGRVRSWFGDIDDEATAALVAVESDDDPSDEDLAQLAALVTAKLNEAPKIVSELGPLVETARSDAVLGPVLSQAGSVAEASTVITQTAIGDRNVQVGQAGESVTVEGDTTLPGPGPQVRGGG